MQGRMSSADRAALAEHPKTRTRMKIGPYLSALKPQGDKPLRVSALLQKRKISLEVMGSSFHSVYLG